MAEMEFEDDNVLDDLEDIQKVGNWAEGAALWSTDWTTETVLSQLTKGNIDLEPSFQRRSAWTERKQSLFIESLLLGLPIPQLILAEDKNRRGAFIVIDGKQRLLAIRRFCATQDNNDGFDPLRLSGLQERDDLNGRTYEDFQGDLALADELAALQNGSIRTVVIRNWREESYLYEVFLRINTGSVQLSPQELRQALHPGHFSNFVDQASADSIELRRALNNDQPDFRMRDAEILLRFIAYKNFSNDYAGNLKLFLDRTTQRLTADWEIAQENLGRQVAQMEAAFEFTRNVFSEDHYLRKWNGEAFERRKNRAVFDIMLHYFSNPELRDALQNHGTEVKDAFVRLCSTDADFLGALERTTKSIEANNTRFSRWGEVVRDISGAEVEIPQFGR